jgi:hypothetical protein
VVAVHGIGNEYRGAATMHANWFPAMRDGLAHAGENLRPEDLTCAFYGDLFRPPDRVLTGNMAWHDADDVTDDFELELLTRWWSAAARADSAVVSPDERTLMRAPRSAQAALNALSGSRFFAGLAEQMMIFSLKQVNGYLADGDLRDQILARVEQVVDGDTRVLVGHSLGSVVAYEALCAHPEWPVRALVTCGSPLGIRNLIFDRLRPPPDRDGHGRWPGSVSAWTNICDEGDVVALQKDLRPLFGSRVRCLVVHCGARAHDVTRYLTSAAMGQAIAAGIADV